MDQLDSVCWLKKDWYVGWFQEISLKEDYGTTEESKVYVCAYK